MRCKINYPFLLSTLAGFSAAMRYELSAIVVIIMSKTTIVHKMNNKE